MNQLIQMLKQMRLIGGAGVILLAVVVVAMSVFTVGQNQRVVVSSFGQYNYTAEPGLHFKVPFRDATTTYRTDISSLSPGHAVNTYTEDNQEVDVQYTLFYRIPPAKVEFIYANNRDYAARIESLVLDRLKAAMGNVNVQVVASKRGELRDTIKATLSRDLAPFGIEVTDFQLSDLQYTASYRDAINKAAVQKANVESSEYQRQQAEKDAQKAKTTAIGNADAAREKARGDADAYMLQAKANAEARLLQATAEAKAIQLQGEAQAAAIRAQSEALKENSQLIELRRAERWDGKLPVNLYGSAPIPFMSVPAPAPAR